MRFERLKLFGSCSAVTLLCCFDVNGSGLLRTAFDIAQYKGDQRLAQCVLSCPGGDRIAVAQNSANSHNQRTERPKSGNGSVFDQNAKPNNFNNANSAEDPKRSTVEKIGRSSNGSEQEFAQWIGNFVRDLIDPEELHFFSNSADYVCQLIDQGAVVRRNDNNYGNQCPILALNLDEDTMLRVYDEMDKFNDYDHNFANRMHEKGGLSDGDKKTWSRISDIIKYRVAIYTRHSNRELNLNSVVCTIYGENKELPVKRIYLESNHYKELLINKKQNAETSGQRSGE